VVQHTEKGIARRFDAYFKQVNEIYRSDPSLVSVDKTIPLDTPV
jgi:hypothetical protein